MNESVLDSVIQDLIISKLKTEIFNKSACCTIEDIANESIFWSKRKDIQDLKNDLMDRDEEDIDWNVGYFSCSCILVVIMIDKHNK